MGPKGGDFIGSLRRTRARARVATAKTKDGHVIGLLVGMAPDARLDDLGLDWISFMELLGALKRMLKTRFDDGELQEIDRLADLQ